MGCTPDCSCDCGGEICTIVGEVLTCSGECSQAELDFVKDMMLGFGCMDKPGPGPEPEPEMTSFQPPFYFYY